MIHINDKLIKKISFAAKQSARKRKNYNFHKEPGDKLQRMLNALEPETYIQPHKHENPDKREAFIIIKGKMVIVEYDNEGNITDHILVDRSKGNYGAEVQPGKWHSIICLEPGTVYYEVKDGPYDPDADKEFATWAPDEGSIYAVEFNRTVLNKLNID